MTVEIDPVIVYAGLTLLLHTLADVGMGDSALADRVRDAMDKPWREAAGSPLAPEVELFSARLNARRELETAAATGRVVELDRLVQHLSAVYWKEKEKTEP